MGGRIPLKLVLGGVRIIALSIGSYEQTQLNRFCCFITLKILSVSEGSVFLDYSRPSLVADDSIPNCNEPPLLFCILTSLTPPHICSVATP